MSLDFLSYFRRNKSARRFQKRFDILNSIVKLRGVTRYLEIGLHEGRCFQRVECRQKVGVDPEPQLKISQPQVFELTSDAFFKINIDRFDLVFIDGLHHCEQVLKDVLNSLQFLDPSGSIVLHDCCPPEEATQNREDGPQRIQKKLRWNGDVWKTYGYLFDEYPDLNSCVVERDEGMAVLLNSPDFSVRESIEDQIEEAQKRWAKWDWGTYLEKKKSWNLIDDAESFRRFLKES